MQAHAAPWYTHRWPWLLMLGPATVLAGGAFVTVLALRHPDAMVVDDYYKKGKAINQDLRRDRAAASMGLSLDLRYDPRAGASAGTLAGRIDGAGQPYTAPFRLRLAHPTLPARDIVLLLQPDGEGRYSAALPALEATHWQVVVEGARGDWKLNGSWDWKKQGALTIGAGPAA
jgi:hypothetical protein